jgi:hypothetical protein
MPTGHDADVIAFYSVLRWTPDPTIGETVNVGLLMFEEGGAWARFRPRPFRTRASHIATHEQIAVAEKWILSFQAGAQANGAKGFLDEPMTLDDVKRWAKDGVGSIAFTDPTAVLGSSVDELWTRVSDRFLGRVSPQITIGATASVSAGAERETVVRDFVARCKRVPALKGAVHRSMGVQGARLPHKLDVTIQNGDLVAVAQALPFVHGSITELAERRALLFEAALDLPENVVKLGIYEEVPPSRSSLVEQTRDFIADRLSGSVQLHPRDDFSTVIASLTRTIFQP